MLNQFIFSIFNEWSMNVQIASLIDADPFEFPSKHKLVCGVLVLRASEATYYNFLRVAI